MSRCHCHCGKRCINSVMTLRITWEGLWCLLTKEIESNVYVLRWCISTRNEEDIYIFFLILHFSVLISRFFLLLFLHSVSGFVSRYEGEFASTCSGSDCISCLTHSHKPFLMWLSKPFYNPLSQDLSKTRFLHFSSSWKCFELFVTTYESSFITV